ncbi:phosphoribosyl-dephospho-CoA transferase MdcG domain-containing protein [Paraburkholderia aromaticivorans]|uniref:phosphoribosyl-dephospho-CoA transferase MdcG domain-containing protein n=1 Tax=Paraburkholderia aromaticivorans TaxID=2026199 RepID=UPI0019814330|nr:phosphoribosyl-dephospho-CoA transferase MdcG domain-containing protein [Paraburkholderia aromaticivorans]
MSPANDTLDGSFKPHDRPRTRAQDMRLRKDLPARVAREWLMRAARPFSREAARALFSLLKAKAARIDMQVNTGRGGFAPAEWADNADRMLVKTNRGPLLTADPWAAKAS